VAPATAARPSVTEQTGLALRQIPCQRAKRHPTAGLAVNVNRPATKVERHFRPQLIPIGRLTTLPAPVFRIVSRAGLAPKLATMVASAVTVTEQVGAVPVQPPDQLLKVDLASGIAVRVSVWSCATSAEHVVPQAIASPASRTVPPTAHGPTYALRRSRSSASRRRRRMRGFASLTISSR